MYSKIALHPISIYRLYLVAYKNWKTHMNICLLTSKESNHALITIVCTISKNERNIMD